MSVEIGIFKENCSEYLRAKLCPFNKETRMIVRKEKYNSGFVNLKIFNFIYINGNFNCIAKFS